MLPYRRAFGLAFFALSALGAALVIAQEHDLSDQETLQNLRVTPVRPDRPANVARNSDAARLKAIGEVHGDENSSPFLSKQVQQEAEADALDQLRVLDEKVRSEELDGQWAKAAEESIEATVAARSIPGLHLVGVECRFTLCRIDLVRDPSILPEQAFHHLPMLAPWPAPSLAHMAQTGEVSVYLAREGHELPN